MSTIAFGTADGVMPNARGGTPVPVNGETLAQLADATGPSADSGEERPTCTATSAPPSAGGPRSAKITPYLAALALLVAVGASTLSLRWFSRLI